MFRRRYKKNGGYIGDWNLQNNTGVLSSMQEYSRHSRVPDWYRPSYWLSMPNMPEGTQMFAGLLPIYKGASGFTGSSGDSNFIAISARGNYIVDWGNGVTTAHTDNTQANYQYNFANIDASTETPDGYRQVIIKAYPQAGATLTSINCNVKFSGLPITYPSAVNPWLSIKISGPNLTSISLGSSSPVGGVYLLEELEIVGETKVSGFADLLQNAVMIQCFKGTQWSKNAASANSSFTAARSLRKLPLIDTRSFSANTHAMFNNCNTFELCPPLYFDGVDDSSIINTATLFAGTAIIVAPHLSMRRLNPHPTTTNGSASMFQNCNFLKKIPETLDFSKNRFFNNIFQNCYCLSNIPKNFNTSSGVTFSNFMYGAYALKDVSGICMAFAGDISSAFRDTYRLKNIGITSIGMGVTSGPIIANESFFNASSIKAPLLNWSRISNITNGFRASTISIIPGGGITSGMSGGATFGWSTTSFLSAALALKSFPILDGLLQNIDMRTLNASPTMLNSIFTGLGTTGGKLNVSGNWGACAAYGCSFGIATAKGWTFTNV